ncbi:unnamed protein product [Enterobius vermicularis]|uniref:SAM domain-containing protein n=1 Tax=Enterobius vermicularis TaxID=51028 RepID=A0A0N4V0Y9_ENTVE|nr:unnamed protein product [Enterobius vermicularis]
MGLIVKNNSTYVIRDNEGRWFLLQTNAAAGTTASESRVHQVLQQHLQQNSLQRLTSQLIRSSFVIGNVTLGQLAMSSVQKPPSTITVSNSAPHLPSVTSGNGTVIPISHPRSGTYPSATSIVPSYPQPAVLSHCQDIGISSHPLVSCIESEQTVDGDSDVSSINNVNLDSVNASLIPMPKMYKDSSEAKEGQVCDNSKFMHEAACTSSLIGCSISRNFPQINSLASGTPQQLLPVFHQQQNLPHFVPQPRFTQLRTRTNGDVARGVENEPPFIECHGESKEAHKVRLLFLREAEAFRGKLGPQREVIHSVDGQEILESDTPFLPMPPVPLEEWISRRPRELKKRVFCKNKSLDDEDNTDINFPKAEERGPCPSGSKTQVLSRSICDSLKRPERDSEMKKKKRRANKIDGVFQANLGTIQNHLHSVTEGYIKNGDAKVELNDTEVVANNGNDVATSPYLNTSEGGVAIKGGKDKFSSSRGGIKEKKRKVRLLGKRSQEGIKIKQLTPETFEKEVEKQPANHKEIQKITDCLPQDSGEDKRGRDFHPEKTCSNSEPVNPAETSLNSSVESGGDLELGMGNITLSDEDLDVERWRNLGESSLQQTENKNRNSVTVSSSTTVIPSFAGATYTPPNHSGFVLPDTHQRPVRTLILKMGTVAESDGPRGSAMFHNSDHSTSGEVCHETSRKSSAVYTPPVPNFVVRTPQVSDTQVPPPHLVLPPEHASSAYAPTILDRSISGGFHPTNGPDFLKQDPRNWSCDEVATWVTRVTGSSGIGEKFRNQDVDGQSLLLMAESEGGISAILTQKLLLKLGPVLKLEKALKDLIAKNSD